MRTLVVKEPSFYAYQDEKNFFRWLEELTAVTGFKGSARGLEVTLKDGLQMPDIMDLIAWMTRYGLDRKPIRELCTVENEEWLRDKEAYWYGAVFE